MNHFNASRAAAGFIFCLIASSAWCEAAEQDSTHSIVGWVFELRSGTPDVPVFLFEAASGLPLAKETYQPMPIISVMSEPDKIAVVLTDKRGQFRFDDVPDGKYRLLAQKWMSPFKGVFGLHGTVIQLFGSADEVVVPRPTGPQDALVALRPPGRGVVQFDQESPNNDTMLFLSSSATEFDPILGLDAMGKPFLSHLIGINRMPLGQTTVIGVPDAPLYAFAFAPDDSPGFASIKVPASASGLVRVPAEPFVAGWSNGRKTPPPELAELLEFMEAHSLTASQLLEIPPLSSVTHKAYRARIEELRQELSREVKLPDGKSARVGDLLAAEGYRRLRP